MRSNIFNNLNTLEVEIYSFSQNVEGISTNFVKLKGIIVNMGRLQM